MAAAVTHQITEPQLHSKIASLSKNPGSRLSRRAPDAGERIKPRTHFVKGMRDVANRQYEEDTTEETFRQIVALATWPGKFREVSIFVEDPSTTPRKRFGDGWRRIETHIAADFALNDRPFWTEA
jgi:hypothetical protein